MTRPTQNSPRRWRLDDPLALSAGALPRLGWALAVSVLLWGAVAWALSA
ncbi:hypothetical protein SAMN02745194_04486 [Roseomonas rosea]|uniref:Uncharacterized protein n=1 Tax=Muricoccus roseus TaxID=198092 RepID=A0A1M6QRJ2_9PROT|nr:hypothetical protein [Roseomonas rosea]SHK22919.1 hypothetical protein SAMN02745194_04486 [Roseomonas rosea]